MRRVLTILFAMGFIVSLLAGGTALAYAAAGFAEGLLPGAGSITNILVLLLVFVMIIATMLTLAERKWSALMQDRIGPNRARIALPGLKNRSLAGLPYVAADSLKMLFKEDLIPNAANPILFNLAPILAFAPVFALFTVVPVGPPIQVFGKEVGLLISDPDFGVLYLLAIASLAVYGTALAGWASNNKFALLGGVRASSQMISYEVALGLSLVGMMLAYSTVQLGHFAMVPAHGDVAASLYLWRNSGSFDFGLPAWGIFVQPVGFLLFFAAAFAETKRAPFDAPEGESEIIGYFVEYSGMKFGLFMISEFVEVVVLAAVSTCIFFGGWHLPFGEEWLGSLSLFQDYPILWGTLLGTVFWLKVLVIIWVQLLIRWTFPRFRYDQIQTLGWKILLPLGIANVFVTGALVLWDPSLQMLAVLGLLMLGTVVVLTLSAGAKPEESHGAHGHGGGHDHGHGHDDHGHAHAPAHASHH